MYGRRVPKCHPQVEAYGTVDELNSALGLARAAVRQEPLRERVLAIQKDLVTVMGELATLPDDLARYVKDGFVPVASELTVKLDAIARDIESQNVSFKHWATPGANAAAAALDVARSVCRRAERRVCEWRETHAALNPEIIVFLNRLSDVLWLLARWAEAHENAVALK
jgi:cob(I)alamin adenosyltransferase